MIETARLILRRWRYEDCVPFAAINADPEVMKWQGGAQTRDISDLTIERANASHDENGFGRWAIERREDGALIGMCGMMRAHPSTAIASIPEMGWRLMRSAWGAGYATEAARAAIEDGFVRLHLPEILAYTVAPNTRSLAVMGRLGMQREEERDFENPDIPEGDPTRPKLVFSAVKP